MPAHRRASSERASTRRRSRASPERQTSPFHRRLASHHGRAAYRVRPGMALTPGGGLSVVSMLLVVSALHAWHYRFGFPGSRRSSGCCHATFRTSNPSSSRFRISLPYINSARGASMRRSTESSATCTKQPTCFPPRTPIQFRARHRPTESVSTRPRDAGPRRHRHPLHQLRPAAARVPYPAGHSDFRPRHRPPQE